MCTCMYMYMHTGYMDLPSPNRSNEGADSNMKGLIKGFKKLHVHVCLRDEKVEGLGRMGTREDGD